jgi:hypothetical protein
VDVTALCGNREKEYTMTSFVHTEYPVQHPGVARALRLFRWVRAQLLAGLGGYGLAAVLLLANMVALMVAAYEVMETRSDGHLLALWMILWILAFAALAWMVRLQRPARRTLNHRLQAWQERRRQRAQDAALWAIASTDAQWMRELQSAVDRGSDGGDTGKLENHASAGSDVQAR